MSKKGVRGEQFERALLTRSAMLLAAVQNRHKRRVFVSPVTHACRTASPGAVEVMSMSGGGVSLNVDFGSIPAVAAVVSLPPRWVAPGGSPRPDPGVLSKYATTNQERGGRAQGAPTAPRLARPTGHWALAGTGCEGGLEPGLGLRGMLARPDSNPPEQPKPGDA